MPYSGNHRIAASHSVARRDSQEGFLPFKPDVMCKALRVLLAFPILAAVCQGQGLFDNPNFIKTKLDGLRFYGASVFYGYSSSAYPQTGQGFIPATGAAQLGSDSSYGAMLSAGWQHHRGRTNMSVEYTLTYSGALRYSNLNAFGHSLLLAVNRDLSPKWKLNIAGAGQDATLSQYLFQPSALGQLSGSSANFNDVAAAFSVGQFSDPQTASALTNLPYLQTAAQSALLGYQILTYNATASLTYEFSRHISFQAAAFGNGGETRTTGLDARPPSAFVMPKTVGGNGGIALDYDLSPRTTLGININANRIANQYQNVTTGTINAALGRKMGRHWFLRGNAGGTYTGAVQQIYGTPATRQLIWGGSLGFRTYGNVWLASYNRSAYDGTAFAVGRNTNISGAWNWHRPSSRWSLNADVGRVQMEGNGFASISGWQAMAGVARQLTSTVSFNASYVHLDSRGSYLGANPIAFKTNSVRVTIRWSPEYSL